MTREFRGWVQAASASPSMEHLDEFEKRFFEPVRKAFPDDINGIAQKTNALIQRIKAADTI